MAAESEERNAEPDMIPALPFDRGLRLVAEGEISIEGQIPWSSNSTFFVAVRDDTAAANAVYKPRRGERPLWDFATGTLHLREMAAFVVSEAIGWRLVPPTAIRDGPFGPGALQLFIPHDPAEHYLALRTPDSNAAMRIAAFDVVINNADRKAGHVLHAADGMLWAIDHGVSFHEEPKLRTVIWDFGGRPVPGDLIADIARFADNLDDVTWPVRTRLAGLLTVQELDALRARTRRFLSLGTFPELDEDSWSIPWPPV